LSSQELARLQNYSAEFGAGSLGEARDYIETAFGASYIVGGVSWLRARMKIKLKTARPANARKDEAKAAEYKKTFVT
jgi:transposase